MKIATVIVTYNGEKWINKMLQSIIQSTVKSDIIVIDNCSTDSTRELLHTYSSQITLIETNSNLGFGGANNLGFIKTRTQSYDYCFLMNQDAWIEPNCIEELIKTAQNHLNYGIISPLHLNGKGDDFDIGFAHYTSLIWSEKDHFKREKIINVPFVNAAMWLIPMSVLNKIGDFDPLFYHYGEDVDWANRLKFHGYQIGISPLSVGYHDRENRPKNSNIDIKAERIYHLTELKNPNYTLPKAIALGIAAPLKKAFVNRSYFKKYIELSFSLLRSLPTVYQSRAKIRK